MLDHTLKYLSYIGKTINRLTILGVNSKILGIKKKREFFFDCLCVCGIQKNQRARDVIRAKAKSCGCLKNEGTLKRSTKHGGANRGYMTSEYKSWLALKRRCLNPKNKDFKYYGGRGITIHERWLKFESFILDMGKKPFDNYTIERINNDGNYEPSNCRWISAAEQHKNKRQRGKLSDYQMCDP